jgi:hypothetical protein
MARKTTDSVNVTDMKYAKRGAETARGRAAAARSRGDQQTARIQDRQAVQLAARAAEIQRNRIDAGIDPSPLTYR